MINRSLIDQFSNTNRLMSLTNRTLVDQTPGISDR